MSSLDELYITLQNLLFEYETFKQYYISEINPVIVGVMEEYEKDVELLTRRIMMLEAQRSKKDPLFPGRLCSITHQIFHQ